MSSRIQRELALLVTGKDVSATRTLRGVSRQVSALERHSGKAARNMGRNLERGIVIGATAAAGAIGYAVKQAMDWESAFAGVRKTVEGTPEQLEALADGLRSMSREMPVSATELAAIAENAGALGVAREDILEFTRTVAMIGATTDVSTEQASTALGQLGNVIDLRSEDYSGFAAALVDLGNKGASTEVQILEIARRSGGAAKLIGIAKEETLGWAAAAANLGINQELAGTSLQRMFIALMPEFAEGSEKLQAVTGKTAKQLQKSFKKDASGAIEGLLRDLGKMPKDKRLKAVQDIFGKGTGLTRLVLGLADSVDKNLTPALENSVHAWGEGTAAAEEYEKRVATTESQLALFRNAVDDAAVTIGSNLLPLMVELAQEATGWIDDHQAEIKAFGEDLAAGLRDAVKWAQSLDWDAITATLQAGAGVAKGIVEAFVNAPAWVQQFLTAGFVANKFTGGVIGDVVGEIGKGLIKGVLGINAGVVNVRGAVVNSGGPQIPGGSPPAPGGKPGPLPNAGLLTVALAAGSVTAVGAAITGAMLYGIPAITAAIWGPGSGKPEGGRVTGKLGSQPTAFTAGLENRIGALLRNVPDPTPAVEDVNRTQSEALGVTRDIGNGIMAGNTVTRDIGDGIMQNVSQTSDAARSAGMIGAMATGMSASRIVSAIASNRPTVNVQTTVSVTAATVQRSTTTQTSYGAGNGSAYGGRPAPFE